MLPDREREDVYEALRRMISHITTTSDGKNGNIYNTQFLPRDALCIVQSAVLPSHVVCPSVCPSVRL